MTHRAADPSTGANPGVVYIYIYTIRVEGKGQMGMAAKGVPPWGGGGVLLGWKSQLMPDRT